MSTDLKVTFRDTSATQYDEHAARIKLGFGKSYGKLFLGDRHAASYVQLKHRQCSSVVNCYRDLHGFSKEPKVKYLNIDPTDDDEKIDCLDELYFFVDTELTNGKNVVVHCDEGLNRSAALVIYYVMRKLDMSLADSYKKVQRMRPSTKISSVLFKNLIGVEKKLRGVKTMKWEGRKPVVVEVKNSRKGSKSGGDSQGVINSAIFVVICVGVIGMMYLIVG